MYRDILEFVVLGFVYLILDGYGYSNNTLNAISCQYSQGLIKVDLSSPLV